jgi:hypothetical protein
VLIIYKEISVLVRTVSGRPQYVEVESSEFEFLNRFELLSRSEQFLPFRESNTIVVIDRRALPLLLRLIQGV